MLNFFWESFKTGLGIWISWLGALGTVTSVIVPILQKYFDKIKIPKKYYLGLLISTILSLLIGFLIGTYKVYDSKSTELTTEKEKREKLENQLMDNRSKKFATPDQLIGFHLEGMDIRLADLVRLDRTIRNKTFVNCKIYGPAVLYPKGNCVFTNTTWVAPESLDLESKRNAIFIPKPKANYILGVLIIEDLTFRDCTFYQVSFMGDDNTKQELYGINNKK